jgi:LPXTG-site transpeptidase (sortase) family protein
MSKMKLIALSSLLTVLILFGFILSVQPSEAKNTLNPVNEESILITPEKEVSNVKPNQILIPDLNINLSVEEGHIENGTWTLNDYSALHAEGSPSLDSSHGNTIIYAHARAGLFKDLRSLKKGSKIKLMGDDGKEYIYKVTEGEVIKPEEIKKIMKIGTHQLTLFTCDGPQDKYRLLIRAVRINI